MIGNKVLIRDSNEFRITDPRNPVKIIEHFSEDPAANVEPRTLIDAFEKTVADFPDQMAMMYKDETTKKWNGISFSEYKNRAERMAKIFIKLGLEKHGTVAVLAFNCVEWFVTELAAVYAGGVITGIYTTNSPDACRHILESSRTNILIVDDEKQMEKILKIKHNLPYLKAVVQINSKLAEGLKSSDGFWMFHDLEKVEVDEKNAAEYETRLSDIAANDCCCIIYTSGTVGHPKGVMLSHDNILWSATCALSTYLGTDKGNETIVSYLPLSHAAGQILDFFGSILVAGTVYFADKDAMKGTLFNTIVEAKPTIFFTVPRLFEKIHEKMLNIGAQAGFFKKTLGAWAKKVTLQHHMDRLNGNPTNSIQYRIASKFVLSKVKEALGFERCQTFFTGAAPLSEETKKYFLSLDFLIVEGYGLSESTIHTLTSTDTPSFKTVGKGLPGTLTKIHNPDENGNGEICIKGRHVFMGYINEMQKTTEAIDDERWLHSGDVGLIDQDGYIYVTGRIKELLITSGGENIPFLLVENLVKSECCSISNAFLVGDARKFLTMLITLKTEINENGTPSDDLADDTIKWLESNGLNFTKLSEILANGGNEKVLSAIQEAVNRANAKSISSAQKVQKFAILPHDFSIATGELTPTLKLKRNVVLEKYKEIIEKFYS